MLEALGTGKANPLLVVGEARQGAHALHWGESGPFREQQHPIVLPDRGSVGLHSGFWFLRCVIR
jgi:hypothetical protein